MPNCPSPLFGCADDCLFELGSPRSDPDIVDLLLSMNGMLRSIDRRTADMEAALKQLQESKTDRTEFQDLGALLKGLRGTRARADTDLEIGELNSTWRCDLARQGQVPERRRQEPTSSRHAFAFGDELEDTVCVPEASPLNEVSLSRPILPFAGAASESGSSQGWVDCETAPVCWASLPDWRRSPTRSERSSSSSNLCPNPHEGVDLPTSCSEVVEESVASRVQALSEATSVAEERAEVISTEVISMSAVRELERAEQFNKTFAMLVGPLRDLDGGPRVGERREAPGGRWRIHCASGVSHESGGGGPLNRPVGDAVEPGEVDVD